MALPPTHPAVRDGAFVTLNTYDGQSVNVSWSAARRSFFLASLLEGADQFTATNLPLTPTFCTHSTVSFIANFLHLEDACHQMSESLKSFVEQDAAVESVPDIRGPSNPEDTHGNLLQNPGRACCRVLGSRFLMSVLKAADFLDIEGLRTTALLELCQRILGGVSENHRELPAVLVPHAQQELPRELAEDSFLLEALLNVAHSQSPTFHSQWSATFMSSYDARILLKLVRRGIFTGERRLLNIMLVHLEHLSLDSNTQLQLMNLFLAKLGPAVIYQAFRSVLVASCETTKNLPSLRVSCAMLELFLRVVKSSRADGWPQEALDMIMSGPVLQLLVHEDRNPQADLSGFLKHFPQGANRCLSILVAPDAVAPVTPAGVASDPLVSESSAAIDMSYLKAALPGLADNKKMEERRLKVQTLLFCTLMLQPAASLDFEMVTTAFNLTYRSKAQLPPGHSHKILSACLQSSIWKLLADDYTPEWHVAFSTDVLHEILRSKPKSVYQSLGSTQVIEMASIHRAVCGYGYVDTSLKRIWGSPLQLLTVEGPVHNENKQLLEQCAKVIHARVSKMLQVLADGEVKLRSPWYDGQEEPDVRDAKPGGLIAANGRHHGHAYWILGLNLSGDETRNLDKKERWAFLDHLLISFVDTYAKVTGSCRPGLRNFDALHARLAALFISDLEAGVRSRKVESPGGKAIWMAEPLSSSDDAASPERNERLGESIMQAGAAICLAWCVNPHRQEELKKAYDALRKFGPLVSLEGKTETTELKGTFSKDVNGFEVFCEAKKNKVHAKLPPAAGIGKVKAKMQEMWRNLNEEDRDRFERTALWQNESLRIQQQATSTVGSSRSNVGKSFGKGKVAKRGGAKPRTRNAYIIFVSESRPQILAQSPHLSPPEVIKALASKWRELSAEEKSFWQDKALAEKEESGAVVESGRAAGKGGVAERGMGEGALKFLLSSGRSGGAGGAGGAGGSGGAGASGEVGGGKGKEAMQEAVEADEMGKAMQKQQTESGVPPPTPPPATAICGPQTPPGPAPPHTQTANRSIDQLSAEDITSQGTLRALKIISPGWRVNRWCLNCGTFKSPWGKLCQCCRYCERHEDACVCQVCYLCDEKLQECDCSEEAYSDSDDGGGYW